MYKGVDKSLFQAVIKVFILFVFLSGSAFSLKAQAPDPPIPVEMLFGNRQLYFQVVVKKKFTSESRFSFFSVATYSASYDNDLADYSITIPVQFSYSIGKGFGVMAGTDINSAAGFSPIVGPQHSFASRQFLAVTVASFFLNQDNDLKIFGLYEYKPPISKKWTWYNRLQFIYNFSLKEKTHNRSYLYLRSGLKIKSMVFGLGANWDQVGPKKLFRENYGLFVRWEFK